jgi:hypothetical protein
VSGRRAVILPALCAAALLLCGQMAAAKPHHPAPSRVLATGDDTPDYSLLLSRTKVAPGPSIIQFANAGEDAHDLKVQRVGSSKVFSIGELKPGTTENLSIGHLHSSSKYRLWCSLPNHADYGMEAYLKTKRKR